MRQEQCGTRESAIRVEAKTREAMSTERGPNVRLRVGSWIVAAADSSLPVCDRPPPLAACPDSLLGECPRIWLPCKSCSCSWSDA